MNHNFAIFFLTILFVQTIGKIPCDPDSFQFRSPPHSAHYKGSYSLTVGTRDEIGCAINASYRWELLKLVNNTFRIVEPSVFEEQGPTKTKTNIINFSRLKEDIFGKEFVVRVILHPRPTHFPSYRLHYIRVREEDYRMKIVGGPYRVHAIGEGTLWLNVTFDRETGAPFEMKNLSWKCIPPFKSEESNRLNWPIFELDLTPGRRHNCTVIIDLPNDQIISASQLIDIEPYESTPILEILCISNCFNANNSQATILQYICHASCNGTPSWLPEPFDLDIFNKFVYPKTPINSLLIPPGTFSNGQTYKIVISLGNKLGNYTLNYMMPITELFLNCVENCYNAKKIIKLRATCPNECQDDLYHWEFKPYPKVWTIDDYTKTTNTNEFVFSAGFFPKGTGALVRVRNAGNFAFLTFKVEYSVPQVTILCQPECNNTGTSSFNPLAPVTLQVKCLSFCSDIIGYIWEFIPVMPGRNWWMGSNEDNTTVLIPEETYRGVPNVTATVYPYDVGLPASVTLIFEIDHVLDLYCESNCADIGVTSYAEYQIPASYIVLCQGHCANMSYKWFVIVNPKGATNPTLTTIILNEGHKLFIPGLYLTAATESIEIIVTAHMVQKKIEVPYKLANATLRIVCLKNCLEYADSTVNLVLLGHCKRSCLGHKLIWTILEYEHEKVYWHDKFLLSYLNRTLTFKKNAFKPGETIIIGLYSKFLNYSDKYRVQFKNLSPILQLDCKRNCERPRTSKEVELELICTANCANFESTKFNFSLTPEPENMWNNIIIEPETNTSFKIQVLPNTLKYTTLFKAEMNDSMAMYILPIGDHGSVISFSCSPKPCEKRQNIRKKFTISAKCADICRDNEDFIWFLNPLPPDFDWDKRVIRTLKNRSLTFVANTFQHLDIINFTVSDNLADSTILINFREEPPQLLISCVKNCNHSEPLSPVRIAVECQWNCEFVSDYQWTLDPLSPNFQYDIEMEPNNQAINIKGNTYKDGDVVQITASWSVYNVSLTIFFHEKPPQLVIDCMRNCDYDSSRDTVLQLNCRKNCHDREVNWNITSGMKPLSFRYSNKIVIIDPYTYAPKHLVNFTACQYKTCATKYIIFTLPRYSLEIIVRSKGYKPFIALPTQSSVFNANCTKNCDDNMKYTWTLNPYPISFIYGEDYRIGSRTVVFFIRENFFQNGTCVQIILRSKESSTQLHICYSQPAPVTRMFCDQNCGYPNPSLSVILSVRCFEHCYNLVYDWEFRPTLKFEPIISDDKQMVTLLPNMFRDGDSLTVIVQNQINKVMREFVFALPTPILSMNCDPSCRAADPRYHLVLSVSCIKNCVGDRPKYTWDMAPTLKNFLWSVNVTFFNENKSMMIHPNTYENRSIVYVTVTHNRGVAHTTKIMFLEPTPKIIFNCTNICHAYPEADNAFSIRCQDCPDILDLFCYVQPPPTEDYGFWKYRDMIFIQKNSYTDGSKIVINCSIHEVREILEIQFNLSPTFAISCAFLPTLGISGITTHGFECTNYLKDGTYKVFQKVVRDGNEFFFLLYKGTEPVQTGIYLCDGDPTSAEIIIGRNWISQFIQSIKLNITSFVNMYGEITVSQFIEYLNFKLAIYNILLDAAKYIEALNLATSLECMLGRSNLDNNQLLYYRKQLLDGLYILVSKDEPYTALELTALINSGLAINAPNLHVSMEVVVMSCNRTLYWNQTYYRYDKRAQHEFIKALGRVIRILMNNSDILQLNIFPHEFEYYEEQRFYLHASALRHFKSFTISALKSLDCLMNLIGLEGKTSSMGLKTVSVGISTYTNNSYGRLYDGLSGCFVELHSMVLSKPNEEVTIKMMVFYMDILYWMAPTDASIVSLDVHMGGEKLTHARHTIGIKLKMPIKFFTIVANLKDNTLETWIVFLPINYTLEIIPFGENVTLSASVSKPDLQYVLDYGLHRQKLFYVATKIPIYIGAIGSGPIAVFMAAITCLTWHGKRWRWGFDGCVVSTNQGREEDLIVCECNMMSLFSADVKPVNVFNDHENNEPPFEAYHEKNMIFILAMIVLAATSLFSLCVAVNKDRKCRKRPLFNLMDNDPNDFEGYIIVVQTGFWRNSGTTSRVAIQIFGTERKSKVHLLNVNNERALQRNNFDVFLLRTSVSLGEITRLRMWHDSFGDNPHWFCDSVIIKHKKTRYIFEVSRWFSLIFKPYTTIGTFRPVIKKNPPTLSFWIKDFLRNYNTSASRWTLRSFGKEHTKMALLTIVEILLVMAMVAYMLDVVDDSKETNLFVFFGIVVVVVITSVCFVGILEFILKFSR